jgi:hypothetical protein
MKDKLAGILGSTSQDPDVLGSKRESEAGS